jgi:hypothetical protein
LKDYFFELLLPLLIVGEPYVAPSSPPKDNDAATLEVLEQDLQNCRDLLELEPDSKWTRLSMVLVMRTIDRRKHYDDIIASIDKLKV